MYPGIDLFSKTNGLGTNGPLWNPEALGPQFWETFWNQFINNFFHFLFLVLLLFGCLTSWTKPLLFLTFLSYFLPLCLIFKLLFLFHEYNISSRLRGFFFKLQKSFLLLPCTVCFLCPPFLFACFKLTETVFGLIYIGFYSSHIKGGYQINSWGSLNPSDLRMKK